MTTLTLKHIDETFNVQLRQRSPGTLDSYLHWGFAEFSAA